MEDLNFNVIDDWKEWEGLVLSANEYSFLQSWQFGELYKDLGHQALRVAAAVAGKPVLAFSVLIISAKRGKVLQLRHAPMFLPEFYALTEQDMGSVVAEFLHYVRSLGTENSCDFIRMQPLVQLDSNNPIASGLQKSAFRKANIHNIDAEKTLILDLTQGEESILKNMRKQTRYYIRRAEKDGITISRHQDLQALQTFFEIHHDTTLRQKFISYSYEYYQKSFEHTNEIAESELSAEVFLAEYQGKYIAGAIIVFFGRKAFYSDGGSLSEYAKLPASYGIQWAAISRALEKGCETYNFWGGVSPEKENTNYPWYGIDLFKRGFGGDRTEYLHAHDLGLTWKYKLTRVWEYFEKLRRGY